MEESNQIPKSFTTGDVLMFFPNRKTGGKDKFRVSCGTPTTRTLVLFGLINREFVEHHYAISRRSLLRSEIFAVQAKALDIEVRVRKFMVHNAFANHQNIQETSRIRDFSSKNLTPATPLMFYAQSLNSVLKSLLSAFTHKQNAPVELGRRYLSNFIREH